jgi:hypothetical protein
VANAARLEELKKQQSAYETELAQWKSTAAKYAGAAAGGEGEEEDGGGGGGGGEEMDAALLEAHLGAGSAGASAAASEAFTMGDALVDVRARAPARDASLEATRH